jgi:hypothetical protein
MSDSVARKLVVKFAEHLAALDAEPTVLGLDDAARDELDRRDAEVCSLFFAVFV